MKLDEYLAEFAGVDPEEALEMLIDFSEQLPPLTEQRAQEGETPRCRVQECQTPVFLWVDVVEGRIRLEARVTERSPTVRGFVALLVEGLSGERAADVARLPDNLLPQLQLQETLGMTRQRGFQGILARIKREAKAAAG